MWDIIRELVADGVTIFLTTQYLDEADQLADRIAVLDRGRIVAEGSPDELKRRIPGGHIRLRFADPGRLGSAAGSSTPPPATRRSSSCRSERQHGRLAPALLERLEDAGIEVEQLSIHGPDLDDVFFAVTGHPHGRGDSESDPVMTTLAYTVTDSATMLRRNLRRLRRYPSMTVLLVGMPIVFLLLFVYVFGGQLSAGLSQRRPRRPHRLPQLHDPGDPAHDGGRRRKGTAIVVAMDMTEGIIDRFRTMAIARAAVLTGHVLGSLIQALLGVAVVVGVAVALGFRPTAGPVEWLAAVGDHGAVRLRPHLARDRARPRRQERRDGQQHADVPHPAAVPRQRLRPHRDDADRTPPVRRVPTLHAGDRDPARPAHRHPRRNKRDRRRRLERRHRGGLLLLGHPPLQPPAALSA